jgi:leucyl-tRNA synthetase
MHTCVIRRFVEVQLLLMTPVCPHFSDYLWRNALDNKSSIIRARWPVSEPVDRALLNAK